MLSGRQYEIYHKDTSADAFGEFHSFISLWRSKSLNGNIPSWSDFQFEDFDGWYGRLSLFEFEDDETVRVILWGTQLTQWWGVDLTKRNLVDQWNEHANYWTEGEGVYIRQFVQNPGIGRWLGTLNIVDRDFVVIEAIDVPLQRDNHITHVLSAYVIRDKTWAESPNATSRDTF